MATSSSSKPRKHLTLKEKVEVIQLSQKSPKLSLRELADDRCTAQEYVSSENDIPTCPNFDDETWDRDFIESIQPADNSRNDEHSDDSDDEEEMEVPPAPKLKNLRDVISSLEDVKYFMEFHGFTRESAQVHSLIDSATFANTPGKQSDIRSYLKPT
jgi:hypothetical protein